MLFEPTEAKHSADASHNVNAIAFQSSSSGSVESSQLQFAHTVAPTIGNFPVVVTLDTTEGSERRLTTWAMSFANVDPFSPIGILASSEEPAQVESALIVASGTSDLIVDGICFAQRSSALLTAGVDQDVLIQTEGVDSRLQIAGSSKPGGPETTMSWTHDLGPHTHYAVALRPVR